MRQTVFFLNQIHPKTIRNIDGSILPVLSSANIVKMKIVVSMLSDIAIVTANNTRHFLGFLPNWRELLDFYSNFCKVSLTGTD